VPSLRFLCALGVSPETIRNTLISRWRLSIFE